MDPEALSLLRRIADGVDTLVAAAPKPESRVMRVLGTVATVTGASGIIALADIILGWFR
jgi:hypothetical protein